MVRTTCPQSKQVCNVRATLRPAGVVQPRQHDCACGRGGGQHAAPSVPTGHTQLADDRQHECSTATVDAVSNHLPSPMSRSARVDIVTPDVPPTVTRWRWRRTTDDRRVSHYHADSSGYEATASRAHGVSCIDVQLPFPSCRRPPSSPPLRT